MDSRLEQRLARVNAAVPMASVSLQGWPQQLISQASQISSALEVPLGTLVRTATAITQVDCKGVVTARDLQEAAQHIILREDPGDDWNSEYS